MCPPPTRSANHLVRFIGGRPTIGRNIAGTVSLNRADAGQLKVTGLDVNGDPRAAIGNAARIELQPTTLYYLIER